MILSVTNLSLSVSNLVLSVHSIAGKALRLFASHIYVYYAYLFFRAFGAISTGFAGVLLIFRALPFRFVYFHALLRFTPWRQGVCV